MNAVSTRASQRKGLNIVVSAEFPCDYFLATYDPSGGKWRVFYRAGQLVYRKRIGSRAWTEEKTKGENLDPKYKE